MSVIQVADKKFETLISADQIRNRISEMAAEMNRDLLGQQPLFIPILNGSFVFAADLFRELDPGLDPEIHFIQLTSYQGTRSTGHVRTSIGLEKNLTDRTVVILEDIVETGRTIFEFLPQVWSKNPKKVCIASLLFKPAALKVPVQIKYVGFTLPNDFLVGYGLDYQGQGRNLPSIYRLLDEVEGNQLSDPIRGK